MTVPVLIFAATYLALAIGRIPGLRVDRAGAAVIGAALMLAANAITMQEAYAAIDYDTIALLFGMMIVVANLRLSGFFAMVSAWVVTHARGPLTLLTGIVVVSGVFSAFFVNDTMCLVLTPLVLDITEQLRRNPLPYLLAVAMSANIGSAATITGNPQNMMIGSFSHIPYRTFAAALSPVAAIGLILTVVVIAVVYRQEFGDARFQGGPVQKPAARIHLPAARIHRALLWKSVAVSLIMIAFFFAGAPVPKVALIAGASLLLTRRIKPERIYREIDWSLLMLFIGLFVVTGAVEKTNLPAALFAGAARFHPDRTRTLSVFAALLSNLVSNVPAVLVFKNFVSHLPNAAHAWLVLAMSSTFAGNLTILGSVANLIVVQRAQSRVRIGFWEYARAGIPLTVATLVLGIWMLR